MKTIETLEYGLLRTDVSVVQPENSIGSYDPAVDYTLYLDSPADVFNTVINSGGAVALNNLTGAKNSANNPIALSEIPGGTRISIYPERTMRDKKARREDIASSNPTHKTPDWRLRKLVAVTQIINLLDQFDKHTPDEKKDPRIAVSMSGPTHHGRGRGMNITASWPDQDIKDIDLQELAKEQMIRVADKLVFKRSHDLNKLISAQVSRESCVVLHADSTGPIHSSMSLATLPTFDPLSGSFRLWENNLQRPDRKIITMVGAIAIAKADQLLSQDN